MHTPLICVASVNAGTAESQTAPTPRGVTE